MGLVVYGIAKLTFVAQWTYVRPSKHFLWQMHAATRYGLCATFLGRGLLMIELKLVGKKITGRGTLFIDQIYIHAYN